MNDEDPELTIRPKALPPSPVRADRSGLSEEATAIEIAPRAFEERYETKQLLGRGGMGEVMLTRDHTIGRDVAMKRITPESEHAASTLRRRFVREARVQGQLEHPSVVPVYDFGTDADGAMYFTMKRIRGSSLGEVLGGLRRKDEHIVHHYSLRRLLTLFGNVCMAIHYAHEKGVVHRDLKPANLMFGDFGEVYVLDWGVACIAGEPATPPEERIDPGMERPSFATGMAGTLGYMAPEQLEPPYATDARSDVYALGAILFEILTLQKLHARPSMIELMAATLVADGASPIERAPERDIAPELDRICREATRLDPQNRLATAEAIANAIDAYLDGDRDLALRRDLARDHATRAEAALAASHTENADEPTERASAMREVSAALALDATHAGARATLVRLITEPPRTVPAEAQAEIDANQRRTFQLAARSGVGFYLGYLAYLPFLLWMGVRDYRLFAFGWITIALCALTTLGFVLRPPKNVDFPLVHLAISTFAVAAVSVMFGPFVLVPMLALGNAVAYIASVGHARGLVPLATCLAVIVPVVLRATGVLPDTYVFEDDTWTILPSVFHMKPVATQVFLLVAIVGTLVPASMFVARLRQRFSDAELRLQLQAWQLRQIVPEAPRSNE